MEICLIDSHIHIDKYRLADREKILNELDKYNIDALITVSTNLLSAQKLLQIKETNSKVKIALGYHPEQQLPQTDELDQLIQLIKQNEHKICAIGEVGLPYYLEKEGKVPTKSKYIKLLERFIILAKKLNKPLVFHAVYEDALIVCDLLEKHSFHRAHFHWFKGDENTINKMIAKEYYISITPDILYKERTRKLVELYPLYLMMVETDGPWPFNGPFKHKLTHPKMIYHVIEEISKIKQKSIQEVADMIYDSTRTFYNL